MFKVGDKVTWESQAWGSTKEKTGEVVAVVRRVKRYPGLRYLLSSSTTGPDYSLCNSTVAPERRKAT